MSMFLFILVVFNSLIYSVFEDPSKARAGLVSCPIKHFVTRAHFVVASIDNLADLHTV